MALPKVYSSCGYDNYARPLVHHGVAQYANNIKEADILLLAGGADISPEIYNEPRGIYTYCHEPRDKEEIEDFLVAKAKGLPIIGVCRGMQMLTALTGGSLIQHVDQHAIGKYHAMKLQDGSVLQVNSLHHQMCLLPDSAILIGWAEHQATLAMNGRNERISVPAKEPEAAHFPDVNAFGVQWHPEMMLPTHPSVLWFVEQVKKLLKGEM